MSWNQALAVAYQNAPERDRGFIEQLGSALIGGASGAAQGAWEGLWSDQSSVIGGLLRGGASGAIEGWNEQVPQTWGEVATDAFESIAPPEASGPPAVVPWAPPSTQPDEEAWAPPQGGPTWEGGGVDLPPGLAEILQAPSEGLGFDLSQLPPEIAEILAPSMQPPLGGNPYADTW